MDAELAQNTPPDEYSPLQGTSTGDARTKPLLPPPRSLTFTNGLAIVIGIQIGSGIFTSPSAVLKDIASPLPAVLVWVAAGALAWTGASCFIELGGRVPRNGGIQEYLRYVYNDACACIATWALIFIVKPCSIAMVCLIFAEYLLNLSASSSTLVADAWYAKPVALLALVVIALLNSIGTRVSARIANLFLGLKLLGLGSIVVAGLTLGFTRDMATGKGLETPRGEYWWYNQALGDSHSLKSDGLWVNIGTFTDAMLAAMWAYSGWEAVRNPRKQWDLS